MFLKNNKRYFFLKIGLWYSVSRFYFSSSSSPPFSISFFCYLYCFYFRRYSIPVTFKLRNTLDCFFRLNQQRRNTDEKSKKEGRLLTNK
jgi:hypothetical protein